MLTEVDRLLLALWLLPLAIGGGAALSTGGDERMIMLFATGITALTYVITVLTMAVRFYEGERTAADVLPEDVAVDDHEWDTSTARLLAQHDGYEFYVFASTTGGDCLMTYDTQPPRDWVVGCLSAGPLATGGPVGVETKFDPSGLPEETPAGWTRLTPELEVTGT